MCGVAAVAGPGEKATALRALVAQQRHRGPDASGTYLDATGAVGLGHTRLGIIDPSPAGRQPMSSADGRYWLSYNGEIYNYVELRRALREYPFRTRTDTETVLAAWDRWGVGCLDRLVGMFAFLLWDTRERRLFAARDRFGVKPLVYARSGDQLLLASETRALRAATGLAEPDAVTWATYLTRGLSDHGDRTFWAGIRRVPPGHWLTWKDGTVRVGCWYDLAARVGDGWDHRPVEEVQDRYLALLTESVGLRFRSDVPVGVNLSGGLDSSALLGLVQRIQGADSDVKAFTFVTGDPRYDELPWVRRLLAHTKHPCVVCRLTPEDVPELAATTQRHQDAPFGGLPTLAYARVFAEARARGVIVLLDGQGIDEQWAGYDYYERAGERGEGAVVQSTRESPLRPDCLVPELAARADRWEPPRVWGDPLRQLQDRDLRHVKIPRALRYNDGVSMQSSTELREPFLDHRLVELALRQPRDRKIRGGVRKWLMRQIVAEHLPVDVVRAPKRAMQTPQREWLRGPVRPWAESLINSALETHGGSWLDARAVRDAWRVFVTGGSDNSFYVWQWLSLGLTMESLTAERARAVG